MFIVKYNTESCFILLGYISPNFSVKTKVSTKERHEYPESVLLCSLPTITSQFEKKKGFLDVWGSFGTSEEHAKMFIRGYTVPVEQCDKGLSPYF